MPNVDLEHELANCTLVQDPEDRSNKILQSPAGFKVKFKFDKTEAWYIFSTPDNQSYCADVLRASNGSWKVYLNGQEYQSFVDKHAVDSNLAFDEFMKRMIIQHFHSGQWISGRPELVICMDKLSTN